MPGLLEGQDPSIFDRLLGKLFPANTDVYEGMLGPQDVDMARRQALSRVGQSLLKTGGPAPTGSRNIGQNIGEALGAADFPGILDEAAKRAATFQQIASQGADKRAIQAIAAKYPAAPNETTEQAMTRFESMIPDLIEAGLVDRAAKLQDLLVKARPAADRYIPLGPGQTLLRPDANGNVTPVYSAGQKPTPDESYKRGTELRKEFADRTEEYRNVANGYRALSTYTAGAKVPKSITEQQAIIFQYMKMLDPRSTLMQGQRATPESMPGVPHGVSQLYNLLLDNKAVLTDAQYQEIIASARQLLNTRHGEFSQLAQQYSDLATSADVDPSQVIYDFFSGIPGLAKPGPTSREAKKVLEND